MSNDASLPPNAPIINGVETQPSIHGEEDASHPATLEAVCEDLNRRVTAFLNKPSDSDLTRRVQQQTKVSIAVIEKALNEYDFESLSLSYNGGKDCLVLLILYLSTLYTHFKTTPKNVIAATANGATARKPFPTSIPSIYAQSPDPFPAITKFVTWSSKHYHLDLSTIRTNPRPGQHQQHHHHHKEEPHSLPLPPLPSQRITFRDAFAIYLSPNPPPPELITLNNQRKTHPEIRAIFVGTRRTDPHGSNLSHFDRTDHGWPDFMRIHPVIDWRLTEIWAFLRAEELREPDGSPLAYCEMYDQGYTSLGGVGDTLRNPRLRYVDENGREAYRPAYELTEDEEERLGRE